MEEYLKKLLEKQIKENPINIFYDAYGFTYSLRLIILLLMIVLIISFNLFISFFDKLDFITQSFTFIIILIGAFFYFYKGTFITTFFIIVSELLYYYFSNHTSQNSYLFYFSLYGIKIIFYLFIGLFLSYFFKIFEYQTKILADIHILDPVLYLPSEKYFYCYLNKQKLLYKNIKKNILLLEIENYKQFMEMTF
ncbi:MAG: hypothetical protein KatS3mg129_1288 [Leptospiraceae bacterium]|nr:MAG: hypothetical protein KatS3mg129_1288 [Leptospiraceae bacterium]